MGRFLNELGDAAEGAAVGFAAGSELKRRFSKKDNSQAAEGNAETVDKGLYSRGGYVAARASGKRDYPKGRR